MNFDDVNIEADQEFEVMPDPNGTLEYIIKYLNVFSVFKFDLKFVCLNVSE